MVLAILPTPHTDVPAILDRLRKGPEQDEDHARDVQDTVRFFVTASDREYTERPEYIPRSFGAFLSAIAFAAIVMA